MNLKVHALSGTLATLLLKCAVSPYVSVSALARVPGVYLLGEENRSVLHLPMEGMCSSADVLLI